MLFRKRGLLDSVAARIATRLNPAMDTAIDPKTRFTTRFESYPFQLLLKIVSVPVGIAFVLNAVPFLQSTDDKTLFGWRALAHLGPYHIPRIVQHGEWRESLKKLNDASELQLIESEIAQLLTDIEVVTQRRVAVRRIVKDHTMAVFSPVLRNLAAPPPVGTVRKGQSHFEANLRIAMDVVSATPAKDRIVPLDVLESIIANNKESWESEANEDTSRFREYRAVLVLMLLQNTENLSLAKNSDIVKNFVVNEVKHAFHKVYPTLPLMPLLYQFKTEKLGFEYIDIVKKLGSMLEVPLEDSLPSRKSMRLEYKLDFINLEKLVYLTICYSSLRVVPMISEYSMKVLSRGVGLIARSVLGAALLEGVYRTEEHVIQSAPWYDSESLLPSACMAVSNIFFGALALKFFPFCGLPWLMMRIRDSFSDSYRFL
jgi:hypothetical protein